MGGGGGVGKAAAKGAAKVAKKCVGSAVAECGPEGEKKGKGSTGLGKDVDDLAAKSPTLQKNIEELKKKGYTIKYGEAGKGSFHNGKKKEIVIDPNKKGSPESIVRSLAHESGHGLYKQDPYQSHKGKTKNDYVDANVNRNLKNEGEATLMNAQVRDEIKKNGGPDIGISGSQSEDYEKIHEKYKDKPDQRDKARQEVGDVFADKEHPSTDPSKTYRDYYAKTYEDHYDKQTTKEEKGGGEK